MKRRTQKRHKSHLKRYTAFVPKTLKATKSVGTAAVKRINYYINSTKKTIKKTTAMIDKTAAKSIRTLSKLRNRM
jgi:hypothetical protein